MKKCLLLLLLPCWSGVRAQEKLSAVGIPTSPAASIIGVQPMVSLTPKSYQALEAALFSNFVDSTGSAVLPNDFSLEFTPYWAKDHGLALKDYLFPSGVFTQIGRTSSFSLATTQSFLLEDKTRTNGLAFGYRTSLHVATKSDKKKIDDVIPKIAKGQLLGSYLVSQMLPFVPNAPGTITKEMLLAHLPDVVENALITGFGGNLTASEAKQLYTPTLASQLTAAVLANPAMPATINSGNQVAFSDALVAALDEVLKSKAQFEEFKDYISKRDGLYIDIAYATFVNFPTNDFEFSVVPRQSVWLTPSYQFSNKANFLKVNGVLRYQWYADEYYRKYFPKSNTYQNNLDFGAGLTADFARVVLQFEVAGRRSSTLRPAGFDSAGQALFTKASDNDTQYVGTFSYKINKQIALSYSLGNRFKPVVNINQTLVSLLSLNFGLGGPTTENVVGR